MQMQLGRCNSSRRTEVPDIGVGGCAFSSSFTCKCSSDAAIAEGLLKGFPNKFKVINNSSINRQHVGQHYQT